MQQTRNSHVHLRQHDRKHVYWSTSYTTLCIGRHVHARLSVTTIKRAMGLQKPEKSEKIKVKAMVWSECERYRPRLRTR